MHHNTHLWSNICVNIFVKYCHNFAQYTSFSHQHAMGAQRIPCAGLKRAKNACVVPHCARCMIGCKVIHTLSCSKVFKPFILTLNSLLGISAGCVRVCQRYWRVRDGAAHQTDAAGRAGMSRACREIKEHAGPEGFLSRTAGASLFRTNQELSQKNRSAVTDTHTLYSK